MSFIYFDLDHAIQEHNNIIAISGGRYGNNDIGLLDSAIGHMQNDLFYPTFCDKLVHLVFSVAMNHAFIDGNKRSSIVLGAFFLGLNNYNQSLISCFIVEMENIVLWLAQKRVSREFLHEAISSILTYGFLNEEVKIKISKIPDDSASLVLLD